MYAIRHLPGFSSASPSASSSAYKPLLPKGNAEPSDSQPIEAPVLPDVNIPVPLQARIEAAVRLAKYHKTAEHYNHLAGLYLEAGDCAHAQASYEKAILLNNNADAKVELAMLYCRGQATPSRWQSLRFGLKKLFCCSSFEAPPLNQVLADRYLNSAAKQNHPEANFELGMLLYRLNAQAPIEELRVAIEHLTKAANSGLTGAKRLLAAIYLDRKFHNGTPCLRHAIYWLTKAATEGNSSESQYVLGMIYLEGRGSIHPNFAKAKYWLERAARQGHLQAQYELGLYYCKVKHDYEMGTLCIIRAIQGGFTKASLKESTAYLTNVQLNRICDQLLKVGEPDIAKSHFKILLQRLTPQEKQALQARYQETDDYRRNWICARRVTFLLNS